MTASEKQFLHELHEKHYGPGSKATKRAVKEVKQTEVIADHPKAQVGPTRNELMLKAKVAGIKYFRILTKEELFQVLDHPGDIVSITEKAKARWQDGWGSRKAGQVEAQV